jgi:hypothetical protein
MKKHKIEIEESSIIIGLKGSKNAFQLELTESGLTLKVIDNEGNEKQSLFACENSILGENPTSRFFPPIKSEAPKSKIAKFPAKIKSRCPVCGKQIQIGEMIQWQKGSPAVCADCDYPDDLPKFYEKPAPQAKTCCQCGRQFYYGESLVNGGDWKESYCGCGK